MREKMSRPSSSVPNQCACDGPPRRAGRLMKAGSCGAIQGANRAQATKTTINATPVAASGLWRAFPAIRGPDEMGAVALTLLNRSGPGGGLPSCVLIRGCWAVRADPHAHQNLHL